VDAVRGVDLPGEMDGAGLPFGVPTGRHERDGGGGIMGTRDNSADTGRVVRDRPGAVPGDVPVEPRPVSPALWFWLWDVSIVVVCTAALLTAVLDPTIPTARRFGAAAALVGAVLWYQLFGRRTILSGDEGWRAFLFVAGALVLLGANTAFAPS